MRYEKRLVMALAVVVALLLSVLAAGGGITADNEIAKKADETKDEELIVVGFSQLGSESAWRLKHTASIKEALSGDNGFFLQYENARQKQENQIKAVRGFISQRVDYIVLSPLMEDGWKTVLNEAKEAGIPVILVDRRVSCSEELYTAFVGSDMVEEGRRAGKWLEEYEDELSDETLNILVLAGTLGSTAQIGRSQGFAQVAAGHENWHILDQQSGDFTVEKGREVMASMLEEYPEVNVVVSQNDEMTFGALEAIREKGAEVTVISFDGDDEAFELVESGEISCEVECNPEQGELVAEVIKKLEAGETVEKNYYVEEQIFDVKGIFSGR